MRSRDKLRQPKTPQGGCRREAAVKPQGTAGAPSLSPAQVEPSSREGHGDVLERMLEGYTTFGSLTKLNRYITGWIGYFHIASAKNHCESFDQWIKLRLRMCLWKQWKWVRTRYRELRELGVPEYYVNIMANSRCGPWEMSRNLNNALDTRYREAQGLKSLLVRYSELRQPFGTAWCGPAC